MNDNEFYNFCMKELTKYEDNYDIDPFDSLKKMVGLYDLIKKTNFHDPRFYMVRFGGIIVED